VKNNFCAGASGQVPETYTPEMLVALQRDHSIPSGEGREPENRSALAPYEGKLVRLKVYLIEAHYADIGEGESVNCKGSTEEENDIHVAFGAQPTTEECASITGEISPHYRPATWAEFGGFEKSQGDNQYVQDPLVKTRLLDAGAYRITGQLFFDASHKVCGCAAVKCAPSRSSGWEIHPIYNIEVCKTGSQCNVTNDADWIAFDKWWNNLGPIQPIAKPHTHDPE
jgi:hypothetical protein